MDKESIKKGYVQKEMFEDQYEVYEIGPDWPLKDQSESARNHRRRLERIRRNENTR